MLFRSLQVSLLFSQFKKIIVITGAAFKITKQFRQLIASDYRIDHRHALNERNMFDTMLEADMAIVPASGILFETISVNCVVISGKYIDNQNIVYKNFKNERLFYDADNFEPEKLYYAISTALGGNYHYIKPIDGESSLRLSKLFNLLRMELLFSIRLASKKDIDLTFSWANNPEIRQYSFQKHTITEEEHRNWFLSKISEINCHYLIFEYVENSIGSIRFDITGSEAIISYLLDPTYYGRGFGQILLKKGIEWLLSVYRSDEKPFNCLRGDVMRTNLPSIRIFERFGFVKKDKVDKITFEKFI